MWLNGFSLPVKNKSTITKVNAMFLLSLKPLIETASLLWKSIVLYCSVAAESHPLKSKKGLWMY